MSNIKVDSLIIKNIVADDEKIVRQLDDIAEKINQITTRINTIKASSFGSIKTSLHVVGKDVLSEKIKTLELRKNLDQINDLYKKAENDIKINEYSDEKDALSNNASSDNKKSNQFLLKFIKCFGNAGKTVGLVDSALNATTWNQWAKVGISGWQTISKISKDFHNYKKIGHAIGTKNAVSYFLKKQVGFRNVGHASTASKPLSRFYNNLHNTTSAFNISDAFAPLTGKKGAGSTVAAWAGVALTGVSNAFSNVDEQKKSNGTMSNERVVAETISETAIDTVVTYGGAAVVGAAITAATGVVAAPVVVAAATGVAVAGINAGVAALTGKSATEWVSDAVLDTAVNIGKGISTGTKTVESWFNKISFDW